MKKLFALAILALIFSLPIHALDSCYTGSWADPDRDGEGITIAVLDDGRTLSYFYTFGSEGRAWYVMVGGPDGLLDVYGADKQSEDTFSAFTSEVGAALIIPIDGDTITFEYDLELDIDRDASIPWCLGGHCSGAYTYRRLYGAGACE